MFFPEKIDDSLRGRVKDMLAAFDADAFLSALSLALTLPDICGARMCPHEKSSSKRYETWFDQYVAPSYRNSSEAHGCYTVGSNALHPKKKKSIYHIAQFRIFEKSSEIAVDHIGRQWPSDDPEATFAQVDLDLRRFLHSIESGVERFLEDYPDANKYCPVRGPEAVHYSPILDFRS